jgi:Lrp/AsnC family transcriptional regulator for asnA, asnC and gidA
MAKKNDAGNLLVAASAKSKSARASQSASKSHGGRLDNLEKSIIRQLREDGRKPFQTIAKELGVDEKTVRNRVSKLREGGLLQIIPTTEGNALRDCIVALVAITISQEGRVHPEEVAERIAALPSVSWAGTLLGRFDIIAEVVVDSREALARFQMTELPQIPGVGLTEGFMVMSRHGQVGIPFVDELLHHTE